MQPHAATNLGDGKHVSNVYFLTSTLSITSLPRDPTLRPCTRVCLAKSARGRAHNDPYLVGPDVAKPDVTKP